MASERCTSLRTQLTEVAGPNRTIAPMIIPPDGGWGWVVVMVGLIGCCIVDGFSACFYLFRDPMSKELNIQGSAISYLASLNAGFYFIGALFACSFGNHWGFRMTMIVGAIVTSLSFASGYILQEILYFYVIVGVLGGIGSGFVSMAGNLPPSFYFDKKRSIALGIVSSGTGLGGLLMPNILEMFIDRYGWRNTYLFEAGLATILIFLGILILPLKPVMVVIDVQSSHMTLSMHDDSIMDFSAFRIPPDVFSFTSRARSEVVAPSAQPTIAKLVDDMSVIAVKVKSEYSSPSVITRLHEMTQSRRSSRVLQPSASRVDLNTILISNKPFVRRLPWYKCGCCRSKYISFPERPMMRDDLYYTGSLIRLPEYTGRDRELDYHMQVTRVPTYNQTLQDLTKTYTSWCCHNILSGLKNLFDFTMLKSLAFDCLVVCGFGTYLAFYVPYLFSKMHLEEMGAGNEASKLVSMIGLGTMIGRMLSGLLVAACPKVDARTVTCLMTCASSISITCMVLYSNIYFKGICLFIFGFSIAYYVPLRSLIIVDYFGLQKLTSATGVLILFVGLATFLGPVLAENAMKYTNSVNTPFYMCGISLFLAGISVLPMKRLHQWQTKRAERKTNL